MNIRSRIMLAAAPQTQLGLGPFSVLSVDCPWPFGDPLPGQGRGAEKHYNVMSVQDLCDMASVDERGQLSLTLCGRRMLVAEDAIMGFWRVGAMQQEALDVVKAWGFTVKTDLVWCKKTKNGKRHFGMGRIFRGEHETALICARGRYAKLIQDKGIRSTFDAVAPHNDKGKAIHSAKPEEFQDILEKVAVGPYVELFARRRRAGWTCVGDQL